MYCVMAIDPGPEDSGYFMSCTDQTYKHGIVDNDTMLDIIIEQSAQYDYLAVEMFEPRGMPIGSESIETVLWTGRYMQASGKPCMRIYRREVKSLLCGSSRAKDANIRQALIDIYGPPGTKANPGFTYGVKSHIWAALAVWHCAIMRLDPLLFCRS